MRQKKLLPSLFLLISLWISASFPGFSQVKNTDNALFIDKKEIREIVLDALGNLYLISESSLFKYDLSGKLLHSYTNFQYGNIHSVTVNNHLKIMVFHKETGKIIFLDDRLSPIGTEFDLFAANQYTITLATYSLNNQIWLYDQGYSTLEIRDFHFAMTNKTTYNFENFQPVQLVEITGNNFLMLNPDQGIYLFDSFGTLIKTLPLKTKYPVQVLNNSIYYISENQLHKYNHKELREEILDFPVNSIRQVLVHNDRLITLSEEGSVTIYSLQD